MQIVKNGNERLLNMDEAAQYLGIRKSTLYGMCMRREIPFIKIGKLNKFTLHDIQAFIDKNKVEPVKTDINL